MKKLLLVLVAVLTLASCSEISKEVVEHNNSLIQEASTLEECRYVENNGELFIVSKDALFENSELKYRVLKKVSEWPKLELENKKRDNLVSDAVLKIHYNKKKSVVYFSFEPEVTYEYLGFIKAKEWKSNIFPSQEETVVTSYIQKEITWGYICGGMVFSVLVSMFCFQIIKQDYRKNKEYYEKALGGRTKLYRILPLSLSFIAPWGYSYAFLVGASGIIGVLVTVILMLSALFPIIIRNFVINKLRFSKWS